MITKVRTAMKRHTSRKGIYSAEGQELLSVAEAARLRNVAYSRMVKAVIENEVTPYAEIGTMVLLVKSDVLELKI